MIEHPKVRCGEKQPKEKYSDDFIPLRPVFTDENSLRNVDDGLINGSVFVCRHQLENRHPSSTSTQSAFIFTEVLKLVGTILAVSLNFRTVFILNYEQCSCKQR